MTEWKLFIGIFKTFLMTYKDFWILNNDAFKTAILKNYKDYDFDNLNIAIANCLNKNSPNSVRKLEEETYNLYKAKQFFLLKEVISKIENFLMLFNANNKYDLCRYWQTLEM